MIDNAADEADAPLPCRAPVIILTGARSGSTLLRFILDSHPELACPPETSVLKATAELAQVWNVLEAAGARRSARAAEAVALPPGAVAGIRSAVDSAYRPFLYRQGKTRWCDKSLDSMDTAGFFAQVYPEAQFVCLYRHCLDVIMSAAEACPWGVRGYGFDKFAAQHPGNNVAALGSYWLARTTAILRFEQAHPDRCHRVRYEDLVGDPEASVRSLLAFLGVRDVPGITQDCFTLEHASNGPGDSKIWFTGRIGTGSVGRGYRVPAHWLPGPLHGDIRDVLRELGYEPDLRPGADQVAARTAGPVAARTADPVAARTAGPVAARTMAGCPVPSGVADCHAVAGVLRSRVRSAGDETLAFIRERWPELEGQRMRVLVLAAGGDGGEEVSWEFSPARGAASVQDLPAGTGPMIAGDRDTWLAVLSGQANVATEILAGRLRLGDGGQVGRFPMTVAHATAMLLGLAPVPGPRPPAVPPAPRPPAVPPAPAQRCPPVSPRGGCPPHR